MKHLKNLVLVVLLSVYLNATAGTVTITYHSRANCVGFNESISWRLGYSYWFQTFSQHINSSLNHTLNTGQALTWRSAAYHATEGYGGWTVIGTHYFWNGAQWLQINTRATDCSIYDGWWDH